MQGGKGAVGPLIVKCEYKGGKVGKYRGKGKKVKETKKKKVRETTRISRKQSQAKETDGGTTQKQQVESQERPPRVRLGSKKQGGGKGGQGQLDRYDLKKSKKEKSCINSLIWEFRE